MSKRTDIFQVDAFTAVPFKGNPAGVCILESEQHEAWMQNVAMEMNLSETAFVFPGKDSFNIRFFSPLAEIPLCGHATLASSHILYETGKVKLSDEIVFKSKAGLLKIKKNNRWITMDFPSYSVDKISAIPGFKSMTGVKATEFYKTGHGWILAIAGDESDVKGMSPDFSRMTSSGTGKLIVTARASETNYDFCVRCFVPELGINEDPVTGSAHCALVPYWANRTGKTDFISHQISARSGILKVSMKGKRVEISGQAITILKGSLLV